MGHPSGPQSERLEGPIPGQLEYPTAFAVAASACTLRIASIGQLCATYGSLRCEFQVDNAA